MSIVNSSRWRAGVGPSCSSIAETYANDMLGMLGIGETEIRSLLATDGSALRRVR